jgi:hypothetical protein
LAGLFQVFLRVDINAYLIYQAHPEFHSVLKESQALDLFSVF